MFSKSPIRLMVSQVLTSYKICDSLLLEKEPWNLVQRVTDISQKHLRNYSGVLFENVPSKNDYCLYDKVCIC